MNKSETPTDTDSQFNRSLLHQYAQIRLGSCSAIAIGIG